MPGRSRRAASSGPLAWGQRAKAMPIEILTDPRMARCAALILGEAETRVAELLKDHTPLREAGRWQANLVGARGLPLQLLLLRRRCLGQPGHHPGRGSFITVDGPGGAGKTTLVECLHHWLDERGYPVQVTTESSHSVLGELACHRTDAYTGHALACLVAADRYHHLATEIRPALADGKIVLCDRYVASSDVPQRLDGVPSSFIQALNADADQPDLAIILTADPVVTTERIAHRAARTPASRPTPSCTGARLTCTKKPECGWPQPGTGY